MCNTMIVHAIILGCVLVASLGSPRREGSLSEVKPRNGDVPQLPQKPMDPPVRIKRSGGYAGNYYNQQCDDEELQKLLTMLSKRFKVSKRNGHCCPWVIFPCGSPDEGSNLEDEKYDKGNTATVPTQPGGTKTTSEPQPNGSTVIEKQDTTVITKEDTPSATQTEVKTTQTTENPGIKQDGDTKVIPEKDDESGTTTETTVITQTEVKTTQTTETPGIKQDGDTKVIPEKDDKSGTTTETTVITTKTKDETVVKPDEKNTVIKSDEDSKPGSNHPVPTSTNTTPNTGTPVPEKTNNTPEIIRVDTPGKNNPVVTPSREVDKGIKCNCLLPTCPPTKTGWQVGNKDYNYITLNTPATSQPKFNGMASPTVWNIIHIYYDCGPPGFKPTSFRSGPDRSQYSYRKLN